MADRSETIWEFKKGLHFAAEFGEVEVSSGDSFTLDNFESTPTGIIKACLIVKSTGAEHAAYAVDGTTKNKINITGGSSDCGCVYVAYGVKA